MQKKSILYNKAFRYIQDIKTALDQTEYLVSMVSEDDRELINSIYDSCLLRMCIKYEAFTSEAYRKIFKNENISYNRPWDYTRKIAKKLNIDIKYEYEKAHESWDIYNSLKHVNEKTKRWSAKTEKKLALYSAKSRAHYIYKSLIGLLNKFI